MNMSIFKGVGSKDPKQFWFVANVVWTMQQIIDDNIKKVQFVTSLQDRILTWYIKLCQDRPGVTLAETQKALNNEFKKPKSQAQSVTDFKEIQ